jgi:hypothetical protein
MFEKASIRHRPHLPSAAIRGPSRRLEYTYYAAVLYSVMAPAIGLEVPLLAGVLILSISALCFLRLWSRSELFVYRPIVLLIAFASCFLSVQIFIHGESILDSTIRAYLIWILGLMIVHTLCLRPGFSLRFPLVLFAIAVATIPFIGIGADEMDKARVDIAVQGGLTHPGGLAEWFGFLTIYFAIIGLQARRAFFRVGAWSIAVACLFIVTLTIERGPLFATLLAITIAFRRVLKRGFVPVIVLIVLGGVIYETELFGPAVSKYSERGFEETGREILWPEAVERILDSPLVGVGESKVNLPLGTKEVPPHNVFLHLALSAGIVPVALFFAFWCQAVLKSIKSPGESITDQMRLPFLVYTLVDIMLGDWGYMTIWALLATAVGAGLAVSYQPELRRALQGIRMRPTTTLGARPVRRTSFGRFRSRSMQSTPSRPLR